MKKYIYISIAVIVIYFAYKWYKNRNVVKPGGVARGVTDPMQDPGSLVAF